MLGEVGLWIARTVGADQVKRLLSRRGLQAELRSTKKALRESQERREELEDVHRLLARLHAERDWLQAEVNRLHVENAELRMRLAGRR